MIGVSEAFNKILGSRPDYGIEKIAITNSVGRILKEPIIADRPFPPFDRVTMDGIAINYEACNSNNCKIESKQLAGEEQSTLIDLSACIEIMTGAVLPANCDTVLRYEDLTNVDNEHFSFSLEIVRKGQNIHYLGEDKNKDAVIITTETAISAPHIAVMAACGYNKVSVEKQPKIAFISTGDEIVPINATPEYHQIRSSNAEFVLAKLHSIGFELSRYHLVDDPVSMRTEIDQLEKQYDLLLFCGGVSMGKADYLPSIFESLGIKQIFHKVKQRPGKPLWFGKSAKTIVFGFPGNPVSTLIGVYQYLLPFLLNNKGLHEKTFPLAQKIEFAKPLTCFFPVKITQDSRLKPIAYNGSGDFLSICEAHGFVVLPEDKNVAFPNESLAFIPF